MIRHRRGKICTEGTWIDLDQTKVGDETREEEEDDS